MGVPVIQAISVNGDGTGGNNMNGNYSVTPQLFRMQPSAGIVFLLYQIRFMIADNAAITLTDYGAIAGGLTNGIKSEIKIGGNVIDNLEGFRIKQNWQWFGIGDGVITPFSGLPQMLTVDVSLAEIYGGPLPLNGTNGDYLGFTMQDDLTGLVGHMAWVRGSFQ